MNIGLYEIMQGVQEELCSTKNFHYFATSPSPTLDDYWSDMKWPMDCTPAFHSELWVDSKIIPRLHSVKEYRQLAKFF